MRWSEIVNEELGVVQRARIYIMDIISSLKAQNVESITVDQVLDQLRSRPEFEGKDLEEDLVVQALKGVQGLKIEPDTKNRKLTVFINQPRAGRQVDDKQEEKDSENIRKAALRSIRRSD